MKVLNMKTVNWQDMEWVKGYGGVKGLIVDRSTVFGNPFKVGVHGERSECVELYREWIWKDEQLSLRERMKKELRGCDALLCWCKPLACHGDVIIEVLREEEAMGL